jgi:tetratricopeptide (TPR) repeat protein
MNEPGEEAALSARLPTMRPVSWPGVSLQFVVLGLCCGLGGWFSGVVGLTVGSAVYLVYAQVARALVLASHTRGLRLFRAGEFDRAIHAFQGSYDFFSRHPWIDRLRFLTLLIPAQLSYREMALINIAVAHFESGRVPEAKDYYLRALREFPGSYLARSALQFIATIEDAARSEKH